MIGSKLIRLPIIYDTLCMHHARWPVMEEGGYTASSYIYSPTHSTTCADSGISELIGIYLLATQFGNK